MSAPDPDRRNFDSVEFLTVADLAPSLRRGTRTVRRMLARGDIPAFKRGRTWMVPAAALRQFNAMLAIASARRFAEVSAHSATAPQHDTPRGTGRVTGSDSGARSSPHEKNKTKDSQVVDFEGERE